MAKVPPPKKTRGRPRKAPAMAKTPISKKTRGLPRKVFGVKVKKTKKTKKTVETQEEKLGELNGERLQSVHDPWRQCLLPYIALGWAPVKTSGVDAQCGLYALKTGICEVHKLMTQSPNNVKFISFEDLQGIINHPRFRTDILNVFVRERGKGADSRRRLLRIAKENSWFEEEFLEMLLWQVNRNKNTNFRLGIVRAGYGDAMTYAEILGDQDAIGPIVWIHSSGPESQGHWSAFARPRFFRKMFMPETIAGWDVDDDAAALVNDFFLYQVIPGPEVIQVAVHDGEFVVESGWLSMEEAPVNHTKVDPVQSIYDSLGDNIREVGNVPNSRLLQIKAVIPRPTKKKKDVTFQKVTPIKKPKITETVTETETDGVSNEKLRMWYQIRDLTFHGVTVPKDTLWLQTGPERGSGKFAKIPCRDVNLASVDIDSLCLEPVPGNPFGIENILPLQHARKPDISTKAMTYNELRKFCSQTLNLPMKDPATNKEFPRKREDLEEKVNRYYFAGGKIELEAPEWKGQPLQIHEAQNDVESQPQDPHFRFRYLLRLPQDPFSSIAEDMATSSVLGSTHSSISEDMATASDLGSTHSSIAEDMATASVLGSTQFVPESDIKEDVVENAWGIRVADGIQPSSLKIPKEKEVKTEINPNPLNDMFVLLLEFILVSILVSGNREALVRAADLWLLIKNSHPIIVPAKIVTGRQQDVLAEELHDLLATFIEDDGAIALAQITDLIECLEKLY